ncbi:hypothetical protein BFL36_04770 [Clavibacter michiganensis]|uniref:ATP-grasp domain-containing protein n=1 Tax=Clavibacter michiganensis TaxID=28447 RepID=A0A251YP67_9MICO|nr:hypothetical protein [Clavibacter michiganensis]OUE25838.1 hypothetical protein BFL36_04770 [Clavibacter michiganensis]
MPAIPARPRVLYVSDLGYPAKGRRYCDEDIALSARLGVEFDVAICHPSAAVRLMDRFDAVVVRNSGPVIHDMAGYQAFRAAALASGIPVFTDLRGKADQIGKQYLLDLTAAGYPVIPTVDRADAVDELPPAAGYVVKPRFGADSMGLAFVTREELGALDLTGLLVQPRIDFVHEISFCFVDRTPQHALYAPDPAARWLLEPYDASAEDWAFAQRFVDWNDVEHGIQRVDACRTRDGDLLLVELEDLNPYLSLDRIGDDAREAFVASVIRSLHALVRGE